MRRALAALLIVAAAVLVPTRPAGAYTVGWWLKAYGSATCVIETGNHWMCGAYDQWANHLGVVDDVWFDWYCQPTEITGGNGQGEPLRIRFTSPSPGYGCYPIGDGSSNWWNQFYGWSTGTGTYTGQNFYNRTYVTKRTYYVAPRNPADQWSVGTMVEIW